MTNQAFALDNSYPTAKALRGIPSMPTLADVFAHEREESIAHYERAAMHYLESFGTTPDRATMHTYENDDERRKAWLAESIWSGVRAVREGDATMVFRCLLQVKEMCGRIGGYYPTPSLSDAAVFLQHYVECFFPLP